MLIELQEIDQMIRDHWQDTTSDEPLATKLTKVIENRSQALQVKLRYWEGLGTEACLAAGVNDTTLLIDTIKWFIAERDGLLEKVKAYEQKSTPEVQPNFCNNPFNTYNPENGNRVQFYVDDAGNLIIYCNNGTTHADARIPHHSAHHAGMWLLNYDALYGGKTGGSSTKPE